jgi:hypothetical protein
MQPKESIEAETFAEWLSLQKKIGKIITYSHVPAETYTASWKTKNRNRKQGVMKGVPDYLIALSSGTLVFVEMKRQKGIRGGCPSRVSPEQAEWIEALNSCGCPAKVCYGSGDAIDFTESFF